MSCRKWGIATGVLALVAFMGAAHAQGVGFERPEATVTATKFAKTVPLRDTRWDLSPLMRRVVGKHHYSKATIERLRQSLIRDGYIKPPHPASAASALASTPGGAPRPVRDSAVQNAIPKLSQSTSGFSQPLMSFEGLGLGTATNLPQDNIAVGIKYVIQTTGVDSFAVFDKQGNMVLGPTRISYLWANTGDLQCSHNVVGKSVVLYDQLAHRWILAELAVTLHPGTNVNGGSYCIAVSTTNDPTGSYYLYDYTMSADYNIDLPKLSVWPDGYYWSGNISNPISSAHIGAEFAVFDRDAMLNGDPNAPVVIFTSRTSNPALYHWAATPLPASLDGYTPPPSGSPGYFLSYTSPTVAGGGSTYALQLWQLHVDWQTPGNSQLTGPTDISVAPFNDFLCGPEKNNTPGGYPVCLPQPGTDQGLDAESDHLMYRFAYRNFGDHEALVVNQTVGVGDNGGPPSGIRWYELDTSAPGADDWTLAQQSTFAPVDNASRWAGSLAMDGSGDMALGYSVSSQTGTIWPSVWYTGRLAGDPAGEMTEPEGVFQTGTGSYLGFTFWLQYTSLVVDPADDCTFWYSNEYLEGSGGSAHTVIGAFKFPSCAPAPMGTLEGTVTDAASGQPIADAAIMLTGGIVVKTDDSGQYQINLPPGDYDVATKIFGYAPGTASVTITDGTTTTQNFQLQASSTATLSGHVTDGSGHGWGLYAEIKVTTPDFGQVADVWTDPKTGAYSVNLPIGFDYTLDVDSYVDGYNPASATVTLNADAPQDFALTIASSCTAPGYAFSAGFGEDFNGTAFPPDGWSVVQGSSSHPTVTWKLNTDWNDDNYTGGTGTAADADYIAATSAASPAFGFPGRNPVYDTTLITPVIHVSSLPPEPRLKFKANFQPGVGLLDVDINVDGAGWTNVLHWNTSQGAMYGLPGVDADVALGSYIPSGATTIQLRWHYYTPIEFFPPPNPGYYAQVDDVVIGGCGSVAGGLVIGRVKDANAGDGVAGATITDDQGSITRSFTNPADPDLAGGNYILFSQSGSRTLTVSAGDYQNATASLSVSNNSVNNQDFSLATGKLAFDPGQFDVTLMVNNQTTKTLALNNVGGATADWELQQRNLAPPASSSSRAMGPFARISSADLLNPTSCGKGGAKPCLRGSSAPGSLQRLAPASGTGAGAVVSTFAPGIPAYGVGVDRTASDLWLGSPIAVGGDDKDYRFLTNGTNTGDTIDTSVFLNPPVPANFTADMAYDDNTDMLWQLDVNGNGTKSSCIFELDPRSKQWTGRSICPPFPFTPDEPVTLEYGLAYNPLTNTWYSGSAIDGIIYHFDDQGRILDSAATGLPIIGLTYNPGTGHLFALLSYSGTGFNDIAVFDANNNYAQIGAFAVPLVEGNGGAGFGHDCEGDLWLNNTFADGKTYEIASGEGGWCDFRNIPWLSGAPAGGTLAAGAQTQVTLSFDGTHEQENTTSQAYLRLMGLNTPYVPAVIPVTVHWQAQPVDLAVSASASPSPVQKGGNLAYTVQVTNQEQTNHGAAQQAVLSYELPAGVSFIPDSGGACTETSGTVSCALGDLALGASKTVTITVQANAAGTLASTFTASAVEPQEPAGDNTTTVDTTVIGTADVSASGQDITVAPSGTGAVHMKVSNAGPDTATDVVFKVSSGEDAKLLGATSSEGSCALVSGSNALSCDLGNVPSGQSVSVSVDVYGAYTGTATVTGQATSSANDPDQNNNVATATVTVTSGGGGSSGGGSSGGGGGLGGLALGALLGLVLAAGLLRWRRVHNEASRGMGKKEIMRKKETGMVHHRGWTGAVIAIALLGIGLTGVEAAYAQGPTNSTVKVIKSAKFMRTKPLRDLRWNLPPVMQRMLEHQTKPLSQAQLKDLREKLIESGYLKPENKIHEVPNHSKPPALSQLIRVHDRALQSALPMHANVSNGFTEPWASFDGVGESTGYNVMADPPDPNAAVGEKYVVEIVNLAFGIFDAYNTNTGQLVLGPVATNSLWTGFGGPCEHDNDGDVIVLYDQLAHRWILSQFAIEQVPSYECVAISQTNDPTGAYYLYAFKISDTDINDYPKIGVWPDAYYSTYNLFNASTGSFSGVAFTAFDRAAMLAGDPDAQMIEIDDINAAYSDLPATLDGQTLPPAGSPGLFANYISPNLYGSGAPYALALWQMHVDWTNPGNSRLTGPTLLNVDPFTDLLCGGSRDCLPQSNTTQKLDAITDRLMYRLAYRNLGDHQALVVNQTVGVDASGNPPSGVRWYELDAPAASTVASAWSLVQQSTYAPADGKSRWMGSIAMDNAGDMALGYSLTGPDTDPSIAYTGRLAGDPANELTEPETILQPGGGAQLGNPRWGDYTSMAVAPNGCDFWYTNEYYATTNGGAWSTHIGSFAFSGCKTSPQGVLTGTVTDASSGQPIADVSIQLGGGIVTKTDAQGQYQIELAAGDYTATTKVFGYASQTATVTINDSTTTTQDFQLQASPTATISGHVTDGSRHGYGLYAEIKVTTPEFGQVADVWTDPKTGAYSLSLPEGNAYTLSVTSYFDGYEPGSATLSKLSGDTTQDFALSINTASCSAPGYGFVEGFGEDFNESSFPPPGWTVTNGVSGSPVLWNTNAYWQDDNYTGGSGTAATVDVSYAYYHLHWFSRYDTALVTPPIPVTSLPPSPVLKYKANYQYYSLDALDLDISTDGGTSWQTISHWTSSHGSRYELPGEDERVNLAPYIPATGDIKLRWRYYKLIYDFGYYAQIDDINIGQCLPTGGGLVEGRVTDANTGDGIRGASITDDQGASTQTFTNTADPNLPGDYYFLFVQAGNRTLTADAFRYRSASANLKVTNNSVNTQNLVLKTGKLQGTPANGFDISLMVNNQTTKTFTIGNIGAAGATWALGEINAPPAGTSSAATATSFVIPDVGTSGNAAVAVCAEKGAGGCKSASSPKKRAEQIVHAASAATAGTTLAILYPGISVYGLGVDRDANDLWLGSPDDPNDGLDGDGKDHRYLFDGTDTGDTIDTAAFQQLFTADMAYDDRTGMLWQLNVSNNAGSSCIYELDPAKKMWTGNKICPPFPISQRGLAYDPISNTWYAGDFLSDAIYHFDAAGHILDAKNVGLYVQGLTYNPGTGHLFVLLSNIPGNPQGGSHAIYVLDPSNGYSEVTHFDVTGFNQVNSGAGFGHDCEGDLWLTDFINNVVYEVASGETGWCDFRNIPWLSEAPANGTLAAGAQSQVTLDFDGTGEQENTTSRAELEVASNTPYARQVVPVTVHWQAQPVDLAVSASPSPSTVQKGGNLVYTVQVTNKEQTNHGAAQQAVLSYELPAGVSFIPDSGGVCTETSGTVSCALGTLALGSSKTVTITVQANAAGTLTSTFTANAVEPQDPAGDNTATVETTVIGTADVGVSGSDTSIAASGTGQIDMTVSNAGPDAALDVTLKVTAGEGAKLLSATSSQGSCELISGQNALSCDIGEIDASASPVNIGIDAFGAYAGSTTVQAQVSTTSNDPNPVNNVATAKVTVTAGGGGSSGSSGGGGGGFGWLALAALLALAFAGSYAGRRRRT